MSELIKPSILFLLTTAVVAYLYVLVDDGGLNIVRSQSQDEICLRDGHGLAQLLAKPSLDVAEARHFAKEVKCTNLQPQALALLDSLEKAQRPASGQGANGAPSNPTPAGEPAPPPSAPPARNVVSAPPDDACSSDQERLAGLKTSSSLGEAVRFERELKCSKLRPQLSALLNTLSQTPAPTSAPSQNEAPLSTTTASDAGLADADRRIAALERERDALVAEVSRLQRQGGLQLAKQAEPLAPSKAATDVPERSDSEPSPRSASLPNGMSARVLIHYSLNNVDARERAETLTKALAMQGVEVADLRGSPGAVRTELSFYYLPDEATAQEVSLLAGVAPVRRFQPKDGLMARPGTVELNLSSDGHLVAVTASRREKNHE
jgi:hypothetical protein